MIDQQLFTISDFVKQFRVSRTALYRLFGAGHLRAIKVGRRTMILQSDVEKWLASLPSLERQNTPNS